MARKRSPAGRDGASALSRNRLLSSLSPDDVRLLQPHLSPVGLPLRKDLEKPNRRIAGVYFPQTGIASVVAIQAPETQVEVGLVGGEGMTGTPVVLGADSSPHATYIQVASEGQHIAAGDLRKGDASEQFPARLPAPVRPGLHGSDGHTAIANARAKIDRRLARWLLMAADRIEGNALPLTHEFLGLMLGVRRAGVTEALQALGRRGLIETHRGRVIILDRKGIERSAADSYGVPEAQYRRLIG